MRKLFLLSCVMLYTLASCSKDRVDDGVDIPSIDRGDITVSSLKFVNIFGASSSKGEASSARIDDQNPWPYDEDFSATATVTLRDSDNSDSTVASLASAGNGDVVFQNVAAGNYSVAGNDNISLVINEGGGFLANGETASFPHSNGGSTVSLTLDTAEVALVSIATSNITSLTIDGLPPAPNNKTVNGTEYFYRYVDTEFGVSDQTIEIQIQNVSGDPVETYTIDTRTAQAHYVGEYDLSGVINISYTTPTFTVSNTTL